MLEVNGKPVLIYANHTAYKPDYTLRRLVVSDNGWRDVSPSLREILLRPLISGGEYVRSKVNDTVMQTFVRDSAVGATSITLLDITGPVDLGIPIVDRYRLLLLFDRASLRLTGYSETFSGPSGASQKFQVSIDSIRTVKPSDIRESIHRELQKWQRDYTTQSVDSLAEKAVERPPSSLNIGDELPEGLQHYLSDILDSSSVRRAEFALLDFWYVSCFPCHLAFPTLGRLDSVFRDSGLIVIGVNPVDRDTARTNTILRGAGLVYPSILVPGEIADDMGIRGYPTMMLVHIATRRLLWQASGFGPDSEQQLLGYIRSILR